MSITVELPLTPETIASLHAGDEVILNGGVYAARQAGLARLCADLDAGLAAPIEIDGETLYHQDLGDGFTAPTTSRRLDNFTLRLLEAGLKGVIGRGSRRPEVRTALERRGAVYFGAVGGAAGLFLRHVSASNAAAYSEAGPATINHWQLSFFPAIVVYDSYGGDLYLEGRDGRRTAR